jgi:hypothetical protein
MQSPYTALAATVPDIGLAVVVLGTVAIALLVDLAAALEWLRNRRR